MRTIVAIGIAGALGALARYGLGGLVVSRSARAFPWETFVVNVSGSFVLGFAFTLMTEQLTTGAWLRTAVTVGFVGAYTTFSTLAYETYRLVEDGALALAAANIFGSAAAGLVAVYLGVVAGRAL
ncbi:MAG TPA: fluoride efflux transporter CrcB [Gaiellaceae bacterium]|jgi:fluoride exporter|nr:fluoride efflux transporter CrcB [Gaiellaceae bacterium]